MCKWEMYRQIEILHTVQQNTKKGEKTDVAIIEAFWKYF
jgi:hypothetical protein